MVLTRPVGVLTKLYVQHPMLTVLDVPVASYRLGKARPIGERAQIVGELPVSLILLANSGSGHDGRHDPAKS